MKSLNLSRPIAMLMIGLPGAGKSFFARQFSQTFGAPTIDFDRMRFEILATSAFTPEESTMLNNLADYQIEELAKTKKSFIIDGGCNAKTERQRIRNLLKDTGYDVLVIWVQTHQGVAQARATKRSPRRENDKYNQSLTPEQFEVFARRLTSPNRENYVVISGMHTYSTQAKAVLRKMVAHRGQEAEAAHAAQTKANLGTPRPRPRNVIIR